MGKIIQNGVIYTGTGSGGGGGASSVDQLTDVQLTTPTTGDQIVYNSNLTSPYKWENKKLTWTGTQAQYDLIAAPDPDVTYYITDSDTGNYGINDLADVTINSVSGGDVLRYNYSSDKWENEHVDKTPIEKSGNLITSAAVYSAIQNIHDSLPKAYLTFSGTEYLGQITLYTFTPVITDERGYSLSPNQLIDSSHNLVYDCYFVYNTLDGNNDIIYTNILKVTEVCPTVGQYQLTIYAKCPDCYSNVCVYASFNSAYTSLSGYVEGHADVYESKTATSGGTALSVVTTGEKYSWNNKANISTPAQDTLYYTTTTSMSYTTKSITCPSGHTYIVRAKFQWVNAKPYECAASSVSSGWNTNNYYDYKNIAGAMELHFILKGGETAYYLASCEATSKTNIILQDIIDIT